MRCAGRLSRWKRLPPVFLYVHRSIQKVFRRRTGCLNIVLKLLKVYEDVEKQPVQGENIRKTKKEIEDSLDTMNQALEKLFDEMFQNVAIDISSDIQVLEVMLKQDGLTEDGIHADQKEPMLKL